MRTSADKDNFMQQLDEARGKEPAFTTGVMRFPDGWQAWWKVDNQVFYSFDFDVKDDAENYRKMMHIALTNLANKKP